MSRITSAREPPRLRLLVLRRACCFSGLDAEDGVWGCMQPESDEPPVANRRCEGCSKRARIMRIAIHVSLELQLLSQIPGAASTHRSYLQWASSATDQNRVMVHSVYLASAGWSCVRTRPAGQTGAKFVEYTGRGPKIESGSWYFGEMSIGASRPFLYCYVACSRDRGEREHHQKRDGHEAEYII